MKRKNFVFFFLLLALMAGCGEKDQTTQGVSIATPCAPRFFGNGVYYFPCVQESFGLTLSDFIDKHPATDIVSVAPDDDSAYGHTAGYFLVVRPKLNK